MVTVCHYPPGSWKWKKIEQRNHAVNPVMGH